jgi:hypothetical protein
MFVDGLASIEEFGTVTHRTWTVQQTYGENAERTVVVRLIIPSSAMTGIVTQLVLKPKAGEDKSAPAAIH